MPSTQPKAYYYLPIKIGATDRVTVEGTRYRLSREFNNTVILETLEEFPTYQEFSDLEFFKLHDAGKAKIEEGFFNKFKKVVVVDVDDAETTFKTRNKPHKRAKALFYERLIKEFEHLSDQMGGLPRTVDDLGPHMVELSIAANNVMAAMMKGETVKFQKTPCVGHFNKMYKKYLEHGREVEALISGDEGPKRVYEVDEEALAIWQKHVDAYAHKGRPSQRDKHQDCLADIRRINRTRDPDRQLPEPSFKVFRGMIDKLSKYHVCMKRYSVARADREFGVRSGGFGFFRPGERVDIDEKVVDLMKLLQYAHIWQTLSDEEKNKVRRIKVWVVVAFDLATRYILGMRFCESPNTQATLDVIRMAMSDKREMSKYVGAVSEWIGRARPEVLYTDNGTALVNDAVAEVLVECQIAHTRPAAEHPEARGHIESSFRMHRRVVRHFQGRTFKDIVEKSKEYNSVKTASLPIDEFEKEYVRAILDVYHNTEHEGLGGETPHNAWVKQTQKYKMRPLISQDVMRNIFGMEYTRILDGGGLVFMGIPYHSPVLAAWLKDRGKVEVTIRIDIENLDSMSFLKDDAWYVADNQIDLAPGISLAEWMEVWDRVGGEFKESSEITMDIVYDTLIHLRESGEAAALRNPLGLRSLSKEKVMAYDRRLMHKGHRLKPAVTAVEVPAPVVRKGAFIGENNIGYNDPVSELVAQAEQVDAAKKAASKPATNSRRRGSDQLGSTDKIKF